MDPLIEDVFPIQKSGAIPSNRYVSLPPEGT